MAGCPYSRSAFRTLTKFLPCGPDGDAGTMSLTQPLNPARLGPAFSLPNMAQPANRHHSQPTYQHPTPWFLGRLFQWRDLSPTNSIFPKNFVAPLWSSTHNSRTRTSHQLISPIRKRFSRKSHSNCNFLDPSLSQKFSHEFSLSLSSEKILFIALRTSFTSYQL